MCNIKLLVATAFLSYCTGARLDSSYLPPGANGAGGGPGLAVPFGDKPREAGAGPPAGGGGKLGGNGNGGPKPTYGGIGGGAGGNADAEATIISYENENDGSGNYKWSYETSNGIKADESGELKNGGSEAEAIMAAVGSFSYTAPDGTEIKVEYTADENGFVPRGDHLPTPPPIPPEILKSLEENAAEEAAGGGNEYTSGDGNGNGNGNGKGNGSGNGYRY